MLQDVERSDCEEAVGALCTSSQQPCKSDSNNLNATSFELES